MPEPAPRRRVRAPRAWVKRDCSAAAVRSWKQEAVAVRAEGKRQVERLRVRECLLHPVADPVFVVLGLDDRAACSSSSTTGSQPAYVYHGQQSCHGQDLRVSEGELPPDLPLSIPPRPFDGRGDVPHANLGLVQPLLVHAEMIPVNSRLLTRRSLHPVTAVSI